MYTEQALPTRLFLKNRGPQQASLLGWRKSHTSLNLTVQSGSENATRRWFEQGGGSSFRQLSLALNGTRKAIAEPREPHIIHRKGVDRSQ